MSALPPVAQQLAADFAALHVHRARRPVPAPRPPTDAEREAMAAIRRTLSDAPTAAAQQWQTLTDMERRMLAAYAGLREHNPGESLNSIAARNWTEFTPFERTAINEGVRTLLRRLGRMARLQGVQG